MPSILSHAIVAIALNQGAKIRKTHWPLLLAGVFGAVLPDFDAILYFYGMPYDYTWGHRGATHSLLFAVSFAFAITRWFWSRSTAWRRFGIWLYAFACIASHGLLDACTKQGLGVAFFWPFDSTRYFFAFRPILASPLKISRFFGGRGLIILQNEFLWIWLPSFALFFLLWLVKKIWKRAASKKYD